MTALVGPWIGKEFLQEHISSFRCYLRLEREGKEELCSKDISWWVKIKVSSEESTSTRTIVSDS